MTQDITRREGWTYRHRKLAAVIVGVVGFGVALLWILL